MNIRISRRAPGARPAAVLAGVAAMAAGLAAAPASASPAQAGAAGTHKHGHTVSVNYTYDGGEQTFVVPTGVTSINVTAIGAAGGGGATPASGGTGGTGGEGEQASATLTVTPQSTLYVEVGGVGGAGTTTSGGGAGGFNGGAAGAGANTGGGGGGGASDVRTISDTGVGTLTSRAIVAAGGGGAGGGGNCVAGGGGNGGSSADAATGGGSCPTSEDGGGPGLAGTAGAGGAGGAGGTGTTAGVNGTVGAFGTGGASAAAGSGGGGGGYYGGGGGGGAGMGTGAWGGGGGGGAGSSLGTDLGPTPLAASVVITYTPVPTGPPDLRIYLKHQRTFVSHWIGAYAIWVTNTGTGPTSHTTTVQLNLPRGMRVRQGAGGTSWTCHKSRRTSTCTRQAPIGAGERTLITVRVKIRAKPGKTRYATATVSPTDKTPKDNTSTDKVVIRKA